jgi:hypothetical protein
VRRVALGESRDRPLCPRGSKSGVIERGWRRLGTERSVPVFAGWRVGGRLAIWGWWVGRKPGQTALSTRHGVGRDRAELAMPWDREVSPNFRGLAPGWKAGDLGIVGWAKAGTGRSVHAARSREGLSGVGGALGQSGQSRFSRVGGFRGGISLRLLCLGL